MLSAEALARRTLERVRGNAHGGAMRSILAREHRATALYEIDGSTIYLNLHRGQMKAWNSPERTVAMIAGTQGGKALAIDTPIPTPDGFKMMGELQVGDIIFDDIGSPCRVVAATPFMFGHDCFRVVFDDGSSIIADADHQWFTQTYKERKNQSRRVKAPNAQFVALRPQCQPQPIGGVRTTLTIRDSLHNSRGANNHSIKLTRPVEYPERALPIPPYTLGAWLGDGTSSGTGLTCADPEIIECIAGEGTIVSDGRYRANQGKALSYYLGVNRRNRKRDQASGQFISEGVKPLLRDLGVLNNKYIPDVYKTAHHSARLALLQGLMDTDGYCAIDGQAEFTTMNRRLADDVLELMRSLGLKPRLRVGRATINGIDKGEKFRIFVTTARPIFRLSRKADRQVGGFRNDIHNRYIVAVEPVDSVPVRCVKVDSPSALYLAGREYIVTHNTSFGPWWLANEIAHRGGGDYIAATATFDLFKLKMLPAIREVFEDALGIGRYWSGDKVIELRDPATGKFLANRADDKMWGRIILRSAVAKGGLESTTAKAAWLDEAGQDEFELTAYEAVNRRLSLSRGRKLITTTPYNLGWLKQVVADRDGHDIEVINFESTANPLFPQEEFEAARETMQDWKFRMFYRGLFDRPAGMVYADFVNRPRAEGGHRVAAFDIPVAWPRFVGVDPGAVNTAMIWLAHDVEHDIFYLYRESLDGGKSTPEHATTAKALAESHNERVISWHVGQKAEVQQRLDWQGAGIPNVFEPDIHDVESGIDRVIQLLRQFRLYVFDHCQGVLDQMGRYARKLDKLGNPTEEIKDKATFHYLDALRYVVVGVVRRPVAMPIVLEW